MQNIVEKKVTASKKSISLKIDEKKKGNCFKKMDTFKKLISKKKRHCFEKIDWFEKRYRGKGHCFKKSIRLEKFMSKKKTRFQNKIDFQIKIDSNRIAKGIDFLFFDSVNFCLKLCHLRLKSYSRTYHRQKMDPTNKNKNTCF